MRMNTMVIGALLVLTVAGGVLAQAGKDQAAPKEAVAATETVTTETTASPYAGPWTSWPYMTGDWGGARTRLADLGIQIEFDLTQVIQENTHGGKDTNDGFKYSGSGDLTFTLDTGKMNLWPGGTIILNAEPKWGDGILDKVGSLIPVNYDAFKPTYGDGCVMTFSEWFIWQELFDKKLAIFAGKLDPARVFDTNAFANDERTQFLNAGLRNNVQLVPFAPYTTLGAGFSLRPTDWLTIATAVVDTDSRVNRTGFDTAFHGPAENISVAHEWAVKIRPFDLPGTQRVGFVWSGKDFQQLDPVSPFRELTPALIRLLGMDTVNKVAPFLPYEESGDNIMVYHNFDQYLYTEPGDPTQGFGLFGRFGWARQDVNAICHFYSIGVGGKGVIPERDKDTFGIGYYFIDLSNNLPTMFHSEQGVEAYYNIEVTPWMHITPDVQVIMNPGGTEDYDCSLAWGLRAQIAL